MTWTPQTRRSHHLINELRIKSRCQPHLCPHLHLFQLELIVPVDQMIMHFQRRQESWLTKCKTQYHNSNIFFGPNCLSTLQTPTKIDAISISTAIEQDAIHKAEWMVDSRRSIPNYFCDILIAHMQEIPFSFSTEAYPPTDSRFLDHHFVSITYSFDTSLSVILWEEWEVHQEGSCKWRQNDFCQWWTVVSLRWQAMSAWLWVRWWVDFQFMKFKVYTHTWYL